MSENLTIDDLQDLTDAVALAMGDKHRYHIQLGRRTCAETWRMFRTNRRVINIQKAHLHADVPINSTISTIVHEICHFKQVQRVKSHAYYYGNHRSHNKSFHKLEAAMLERVSMVYGEKLER